MTAAQQVAAIDKPLRCRLGFHNWDELGMTCWLREPSLTRNELGIAMEYRCCARCPAITDVSTFYSGADEYHGVPSALGPLAGKRFLEIINGPRSHVRLPPAIRIEDDA